MKESRNKSAAERMPKNQKLKWLKIAKKARIKTRISMRDPGRRLPKKQINETKLQCRRYQARLRQNSTLPHNMRSVTMMGSQNTNFAPPG